MITEIDEAVEHAVDRFLGSAAGVRHRNARFRLFLVWRATEAARAWDRGWELVRLSGKKPVARQWTTRPPLSREEAVYLAARPHWNLGVRTGAGSGLYVIDFDLGAPSPADLGLPPTVTARTGSGPGRWHMYYMYPASTEPLRNTVAKLGPRVDTRGDGGQVVLPGGLHPQTRRPYVWEPGLAPGAQPIAPLPRHVVAQLRPRRVADPVEDPRSTIPPSGRSCWPQAALDREVVRIAAAAVGTRNSTLNLGAFALGQIIGAGLLDEGAVLERLVAAAGQAGLDEREARRTVLSGLGAGKLAPRGPRRGGADR